MSAHQASGGPVLSAAPRERRDIADPRQPAAAVPPRARGASRGELVGLAALLLAVAAGWLLWSAAVPYGEAPDEPSHVEVAAYIAAHGRLPRFGPDADAWVRLDQVGIPIESHALAPPLPYLVGASLIRAGLAPPLAMRVASLLAALAVVLLAWALVRVLLPRARGLALPLAALLAATPQLAFQAAVANSDIFALAGALAVMVVWPAVGRRGGALLFGLAAGLALLTKLTAYPAIAVACAAAVWQAWQVTAPSPARQLPQTRAARMRRLAHILAPAALVALAVAGPWLARNLALYGELWPLGTAAAAFAALTPPVAIAGNGGTPPLLSADYLRAWATVTLPSLWAGFGRLDLFAPRWLYAAIAAAGLGAGVGLVIACWRRPGWWASLGGSRLAALVLVAWPLACLLGAVAASTGRYFPPHGRYLLPLLPALLLGLVLGWRLLLPAPFARRAPWLLVGGLAVLQECCLLAVVVPHYYGPTSARVTLTLDAPRPGDLAAELTELRGWAVVSGRDVWQPGAIGGTRAWQAPVARVWAADADGHSLPGAFDLARPDVARALDDPGLARVGFRFIWDPRAAAPGVYTLQVCASDARAPAPVCVPLPLRVP